MLHADRNDDGASMEQVLTSLGKKEEQSILQSSGKSRSSTAVESVSLSLAKGCGVTKSASSRS